MRSEAALAPPTVDKKSCLGKESEPPVQTRHSFTDIPRIKTTKKRMTEFKYAEATSKTPTGGSKKKQ